MFSLKINHPFWSLHQFNMTFLTRLYLFFKSINVHLKPAAKLAYPVTPIERSIVLLTVLHRRHTPIHQSFRQHCFEMISAQKNAWFFAKTGVNSFQFNELQFPYKHARFRQLFNQLISCFYHFFAIFLTFLLMECVSAYLSLHATHQMHIA